MSITDKDFGFDQELPGEVATWTAQDFSNFFTRFRPHLERHAAKYLRDKSMVEEVVQEAFFYLMVALPELDSELGVFRFLKWKVRLLSLDVISAQSRNITGVEDQLDLASLEPEPGSDVERAEDTAVVRLALAKLDPRQRAALIANVYEEKTTAEIAQELQISENATRQLLLRARNALRKALVGEAAIEGMRLSEILSIAARKAGVEARKAGLRAMGVAVALGLGIGFFSILSPEVSPVALPPQQVPQQALSTPENEFEQPPAVPASPSSETPELEKSASDVVTGPISAAASQQPLESATAGGQDIGPETMDQAALLESESLIDRSPFNPWLIDSLFEQDLTPSYVNLGGSLSSPQSLHTIATNQGLWADITFSLATKEPFSKVNIGFIAGSEQYFATLSQLDYWVISEEGVDSYVFVGAADVIRDVSGKVSEASRISGTVFTITVTVDATENVATGLGIELAEAS